MSRSRATAIATFVLCISSGALSSGWTPRIGWWSLLLGIGGGLLGGVLVIWCSIQGYREGLEDAGQMTKALLKQFHEAQTRDAYERFGKEISEIVRRSH